MMKSIFEFQNYQSFLLHFFQLKRGNQSRLAEYLECKSSFLTQVIDQKVQISLEQALKIPDFLGLGKNEKMAFSLMVHKEKLTISSSKKFIEDQIEKLKLQNNRIKERVNVEEGISEEAKSQYYSSWLYGAVHILCAFSWIQTVEDLMKHLNLDRQTALDCVQFLVDQQLVTQKGRQLSIGKKQVHLSEDSKQIFSHHINWRLKAIEKLSSQQRQKLSYSGLIGISQKDAKVIEEILLKAISNINQTVQKSGEEKAYLVSIDFMDF